MVICKKHWPKNIKWVKKKRFIRPGVPPSVFPGCLPSMVPQTLSGKLNRVLDLGIKNDLIC
jgi:hypothetical protein